jgi:hypothetical protein
MSANEAAGKPSVKSPFFQDPERQANGDYGSSPLQLQKIAIEPPSICHKRRWTMAALRKTADGTKRSHAIYCIFLKMGEECASGTIAASDHMILSITGTLSCESVAILVAK